MKKYFLIITLIFCILLASCSDTGSIENGSSKNASNSTSVNAVDSTSSANSTNSTNSKANSSDKQKVIDMFMAHGEYDNESYYINKFTSANSCNVAYFFAYQPKHDNFYCSVLVTTYAQNYTLIDYGIVVFSWGNFASATFYGRHDLKDIAKIEFDFSAKNPQSDMTYRDFDYTVKNNSYGNLTDSSDIDEYASTCFKCINQSLSYAQSVLYGYTSTITLW